MKYFASFVIAFCLLLPSPAFSQKAGQGKSDQPAAAKEEQPAFFTKINGDCLIRPKNGPQAGEWVRVTKPGKKIYSGDDILVRTGDVEVELYSETAVKLQAECMVTYFQSRENIRPLAFIRPDYPTTKIKVTKGTIFAKVSPFEISKHFVVFDTPSGVAGVRGTKFSLSVDADGQLSVTTEDGSVMVADPSGNFTVDIGGGVRAILKKNPDGSFSIQSPRGQAVAYSPNTTFRIGQGGKLDLDLDESGTTKATVPRDSRGSVNVQIGNIQANLSRGQGVNLGSEGGGTTVESVGSGTVFTTVDGKNVVSLDNGEKVLVKVDQNGTSIEGQSGTPQVTGSDGQPRDLQNGEKIHVDNKNQINVEGPPCTPSVSPYKTCP